MRWANGTGPVAPIAYVLLVVCSLVNPASAQAANPPNVNQLTPSTGPVYGGQQVVISGRNLKDTTEVLFGTTPAVVLAT
ncbi:MAG: IPT/TIG domain-containing protein, partial [Actinomycetales bacterium]